MPLEFTTEWTEEHQKLMEQGFLRMKDGTLIPWKPNQEPDPLLTAMHNMSISKKNTNYKVLTEEEMIDELVKSYQKILESEKK